MQEAQQAKYETIAGFTIKGDEVDGISVSVDDIVEQSVNELFDCYMAFYDIWETWFAWRDEPEHFKLSWYQLRLHLTTHKHLLEHITDKLMTAYNNPIPAQIAEIITLHRVLTTPMHE